MTHSNNSLSVDDPYDLSRFVRAQEGDYEQALLEITSGRSDTLDVVHFSADSTGWLSARPRSATRSKSAEEAKAYLDHPVLGPRLLACAGGRPH